MPAPSTPAHTLFSRIRLAAATTTCASASPIAATSAAPIACRKKSSSCDRAELLTFEEIARFVGVAAPLGIDKVRLTGGEPLLRRDLPKLVAMLADIPGIQRHRPDHQRHPARRAGRGAVRRRLAAAQRQPRYARPRPLPQTCTARRAGSRARPASRRRESRRLRSHQDQRRHHSRRHRARCRAAGPLLPRTRPGDALHRVHADRGRALGARARSSSPTKSWNCSSAKSARSCRRRTTTRAPRPWISTTPTAAAASASSPRCRGRSAAAAIASA